VDPVILGDINGNGQLTTLDVNRYSNFVLGQPRREIPALPPGATPATYPDAPAQNIAMGVARTARPGDTVTVPITMADARGLESVRARIAYNSAALQFVEVRQVLTADFEWRLVRDSAVDEVSRAVLIDLARLTPLASGNGSLVELVFRVREGATEGVTLVDLQTIAINDGHIVQTQPSVAGEDGSDALITILPVETPALPAAPPAPAGQQISAEVMAALRTPSTTGPVNWAASFSQPDTVTNPTPAPINPDDWKRTPWARDLAARLQDTEGGTNAGTSQNSGVLRSLLRGLTRLARG
jgi:hypothetical protein